MQTYQRKHQVVTAQRWYPGSWENNEDLEVSSVVLGGEPFASVVTVDGRRVVQSGDWIVIDEQGRKRVVHDNVFKDLYERVVSA